MHGNETPPKRVSGRRHIMAAAGYSRAGFVVLLKEQAFRHELLLVAGLVAAAALLHASATQWMVLGILSALLFCVEAINTAIEAIVNEISPQRSDFARDAKDLGSFAVFCILCAQAGLAVSLVWARL